MRPLLSLSPGILASLLCVTSICGQNLANRLSKKLAEPWVKNAAWMTDYDAVKAAAKKRGQPIFGYFTRSYAP